MIKKFEYFDIDTVINDKREIQGKILSNGIKIVLISDPKIKLSSCSVGIKAGYLQDIFEGTAHFLEHLLFMGSTKFPEQNTYHSYIQNCAGLDNAFTGDNITCYFIELENEFLEGGIEMLSWFFREPLLDMKHINSEREIINSEHNKNLLADMWIIDDIFKQFLNKSKYTNFGTGNSESLKDITQKDILNFYNKYYTTDNIYVCIIDSLSIKEMNKKYLKYFDEIPKKIYTGNDKVNKQKINTKKENLIVFKSISQYNFLNYFIIIDCDQNNAVDFQLVNLLSYIIGLEYIKSFSYYLKENNIATFIKTNVNYYYDNEAVININITLNNDEKENIEKINTYLNTLLNKISEISEKIFIRLYEKYKKINLLNALYSQKLPSFEISNNIVNNLINGDKNLCIIRNNYVPNYESSIYNKFKLMLENIEIKIITNINVMNYPDNKFLISQHYKTKYYIEYYNNNIDIFNIDYNFDNLLIFSDITIKVDNFIKNISMKEKPNLIYKNNEKEVYLLAQNKYEKPIINISVIRQNKKYFQKENKMIMFIYRDLCLKILNYYLSTMADYKTFFSINIENEFLIYNFNGLDYIMKNFINDVLNKISFNAININKLNKKYFDEIKKIMKEDYINLKYNPPYLLCSTYFSIILSQDFMPNEAINFLNKLTFDNFIKQLDDLLNFDKEIFLIVGNVKNCLDIFMCDETIISGAMEYVECLTLASSKYVKNISFNDIQQQIKSYELTKSQINNNEINNCVYDCYLVKNYDLIYDNDNIINNELLKKIFKDKLIYDIITNIINEPLFNKIRTIDKLGYIVKCMFKYHSNINNAKFFICYIIQSNYDVEEIYKSINNFNTVFYKKFKNNKEEFKKIFNNLKKSIESSLKKNPNDLDEEVSIYLSSILNKYNSFNYIDLNLEILKNINFKDICDYMDNFFNSIINKNRFYVILNKNLK
jgi:insulysin